MGKQEFDRECLNLADTKEQVVDEALSPMARRWMTPMAKMYDAELWY